MLCCSCNNKVSLSSTSTDLEHDKKGMWQVQQKDNYTISTSDAVNCAIRFFNTANLKGINKESIKEFCGYVDRGNYKFKESVFEIVDKENVVFFRFNNGEWGVHIFIILKEGVVQEVKITSLGH